MKGGEVNDLSIHSNVCGYHIFIRETEFSFFFFCSLETSYFVYLFIYIRALTFRVSSSSLKRRSSRSRMPNLCLV